MLPREPFLTSPEFSVSILSEMVAAATRVLTNKNYREKQKGFLSIYVVLFWISISQDQLLKLGLILRYPHG